MSERLDRSQSVVVKAPVMQATASLVLEPEPTDALAILQADNANLRRELDQSRVATRTLASVAVALARMVNEDVPLDREILIPRDVYERLAGCEVGVEEDADRNVIVRIRDNVTHPVWEGR